MEDKKKDLLEEQEERLAAAADQAPEDGEEESLVIRFGKPYRFEGREYTELDLSGLEDLTAADMIALENQYEKRNPGINVMPEVKLGYAMMMAARAAKLPVEFFDGLPQREAMKVKNRVMGFLFGSD